MNHFSKLIPLLLFITSGQIFAQIADVKPALTVDCPRTAVAGEIVRVQAKMKPAVSSATYNWTTSSGTIVGGQGTPTIEVQTDDNSQSMTATVNAGGNYFESVSASCTVEITRKPIALRIDEFTLRTEEEFKAKMDSYLANLFNDSRQRGYIIIYPPSPAQLARVARMIGDYLKLRKADSSRITIVIGEKKDLRPVLHFWIVPFGAKFEASATNPSTATTAATDEPQPLHIIKADANACELNGKYLYELQARLAADPSLKFEIYYYDGAGETETISTRRLAVFLKQTEELFPEKPTVVRYGKADGNAELRIVLKRFDRADENFLLIYAIKNKSLCLSCCDEESMPKNLVSQTKRRIPVRKKK